MLQYTDNAREGGMGVDINAYRGTGGALAQFLATPPPGSTNPPPGNPTVRQGDSGSAVDLAQRDLYAAGFDPGPLDASFGPLTGAATRAFQTHAGLTPDTVIGPATWHALASAVDVVKEGYSGPLVTRAQIALGRAGFPPGAIDGVFGPHTTTTTRAFQTHVGLPADGIIGPLTLAKLRP